MDRIGRSRLLALAVVVALLATPLTATARKRRARPDLVVQAMNVLADVTAGPQGVVVTATVANIGRESSKPSVARAYLSSDPVLEATDLLLDGTLAIGKLAKQNGRQTENLATDLPEALPSAGFYVIACADDAATVKEKNETNNCLASALLKLNELKSILPGPFDDEAKALRDAASLEDAVTAATVLLKRAGVAVDGDGTDDPPPGGIRLTRAQLVAIARDGQRRATQSRFSLAEFADTLGGFGLTPQGDLAEPSLVLRSALRAWVKIGLARPDEDLAGPPLILAALARIQDPPVDLTTGRYDPSDLRWSLLDSTIFAAGFAQLAPAFYGTDPVPQSPQGSSGKSAQAEPITPCSNMKSFLDAHIPLSGMAWGYGMGELGKANALNFVEAFADLLGLDPDVSKATYGQAMKIVGLLSKIWSVVALYSKATAEITRLSADTVHKPTAADLQDPHGFRVLAGVKDSDWEAMKAENSVLESGLADCARALGFPIPTTTLEMGSLIPAWRSSWGIVEGDSHVDWAKDTQWDFSSRSENKLDVINDHQGEDVVALEVLEEPASNHPGNLVVAPVGVRASIATDPPPKLDLLLGVVMAGGDPFSALKASASLIAGWYQNVATIDAYGVAYVSYHLPRKGVWRGNIAVSGSGTDTYSSAYRNFDGRYVSTHTDTQQFTYHDDQYIIDQVSEYLGSYGTNTWTLRVHSTAFGSAMNTDTDSAINDTNWTNCPPVISNSWDIQEGSGSEQKNFTGDLQITVDHTGRWTARAQTPSLLLTGRHTGHSLATTEEPCVLQQPDVRRIESSTDDASGFELGQQSVLFVGQLDPAHPGSTLKSQKSYLVGNGYVEGEMIMNLSLARDGGIPIPPPPAGG